MDSETIEIQVKVPVCLTMRLKRGDAESMLKEELCRAVDACLLDATTRLGAELQCMEKDREIFVEYQLAQHWNLLPDDECELTLSEDGLFPDEDDDLDDDE